MKWWNRTLKHQSFYNVQCVGEFAYAFLFMQYGYNKIVKSLYENNYNHYLCISKIKFLVKYIQNNKNR
ncbi:hypothetical protein D0T57_13490 [Dysgonomonas sp. 511]|nr:hypothetical protein [Dysgonomonas sp. 511]